MEGGGLGSGGFPVRAVGWLLPCDYHHYGYDGDGGYDDDDDDDDGGDVDDDDDDDFHSFIQGPGQCQGARWRLLQGLLA